MTTEANVGGSNSTIEIGKSEQELVGSKTKSTFKRGLIIATVLAIIVGVSFAIIYYLNRNGESSTSPRVPISLNDFLENKLYVNRNNATWLSPSELTYRDIDGNIVKFDIDTKQIKVLADVSNPIVAIAYTQDISPDQRFILIGRDYQKIFRHSAAAHYDIIDLQRNKTYPLTINGVQKHLLLAKWGPIGSNLIFVQDNDIYYRPTADEDTNETRITNDGSENIFNGICDWVYEEEVFSAKTALWLSPDGNKLAYVRFDDTPVRRMLIPIYGNPGAPDFQYPAELPLNYPKAGSPNPLVKLFTVDLKDLKPSETVPTKTEIPVPRPLANIEHIITAVKWATNDTLFSAWMNRVQNKAYLQTCVNGDCKPLYSMSSTTGWIEFSNPFVSQDGEKYVFIEPQRQSNGDSFKHIVLLSDGVTTPLTSGQYEVLQIYGWDLASNYVFYSANGVNASQQQHIYMIKAEKDASKREPYCMTCGVVRQTCFSASFSPDSKHMVLVMEGPSMPRADIFSWKIINSTFVLFFKYTWDNNSQMRGFMKDKLKPLVQYHRLPMGNGFEAAVKLQLPPNADLSGRTKYPMLIEVYAGPGSYAGNDRFGLGFSTYLTTNRSYIYAQINGRGSGNRGERLLHTIYRHMGTVEVEDQITTTKLLTEKFPFIDAARVGIWGWSYGGYVSGMALAKDNSSIFKCATSVAPVTDWTYYDSIYTERYMGLPTHEDNLAGYTQSRLSTLPDKFRNKNYFLVHGTLDDNVHYQQSMALARSLEIADVPFQTMSYPDEDHALWGVRKHLYHAIDKFFKKCFQGTIDL